MEEHRIPSPTRLQLRPISAHLTRENKAGRISQKNVFKIIIQFFEGHEEAAILENQRQTEKKQLSYHIKKINKSYSHKVTTSKLTLKQRHVLKKGF